MIALSSGEAELYAANRGAREGMGIRTICRELGKEVEVKVQIDATAAEGMLQRRELGKLRHLDVQELWGQQALKRGDFSIEKVATEWNTADIGTKPLNREGIELNLQRMGYDSPACGKNSC